MTFFNVFKLLIGIVSIGVVGYCLDEAYLLIKPFSESISKYLLLKKPNNSPFFCTSPTKRKGKVSSSSSSLSSESSKGFICSEIIFSYSLFSSKFTKYLSWSFTSFNLTVFISSWNSWGSLDSFIIIFLFFSSFGFSFMMFSDSLLLFSILLSLSFCLGSIIFELVFIKFWFSFLFFSPLFSITIWLLITSIWCSSILSFLSPFFIFSSFL